MTKPLKDYSFKAVIAAPLAGYVVFKGMILTSKISFLACQYSYFFAVCGNSFARMVFTG
jgi:hypothetical protein